MLWCCLSMCACFVANMLVLKCDVGVCIGALLLSVLCYRVLVLKCDVGVCIGALLLSVLCYGVLILKCDVGV